MVCTSCEVFGFSLSTELTQQVISLHVRMSGVSLNCGIFLILNFYFIFIIIVAILAYFLVVMFSFEKDFIYYLQLNGYFPILSDYAKDPLYAWIIIKSSNKILKIAFPEFF